MVESNVLYAHILSQTRQNVQLLMDHDVLTEESGLAILSRLQVVPKRQSSDNPIVDSLAQQTQRLSMSSLRSTGPTAHRKVEGRAIWEWSSEDPKDLSLHAGDIIEIISEANVDWWMGRNRSGKEGLFPSNYVEKLPPREMSPISVTGSGISRAAASPRGTGGFTDHRHSPSVQPQYSTASGPPPQPHYPPPAGTPRYYPAAGPPPGPGQSGVNYSYRPPPAQPVVIRQQAPAQRSSLGALGHNMAQSAASGLGLGAGAAIGSGVINSIF